jgi:hypothetical protein
MDPRWLIITPEDETGGRQRRFFGWAIWGIAVVLILGTLLLSRMWWQTAVFVSVVALVTVGGWLLTRWAMRGFP